MGGHWRTIGEARESRVQRGGEPYVRVEQDYEVNGKRGTLAAQYATRAGVGPARRSAQKRLAIQEEWIEDNPSAVLHEREGLPDRVCLPSDVREWERSEAERHKRIKAAKGGEG